MFTLDIDAHLRPDIRLCRYVGIETFMCFVETGRTVLTNVNHWDDKWEVILSKVPTLNNRGAVEHPLYSYHQDLFGQCWCLYEESDAMWRIYSPAKSGVRLESSVTKFNLFGEMERAYLGMVVYLDTVQDLLKKAKSRESLFGEALYKRMAFQHEHEVRLLTHADFLGDSARGATHVTLPLKPADFIEGVTIDPRAEDWYVEAIVQYCKRAGLACTPVKSTLYEHDPHLKIGVTKRWVPVDRD